MATAALAQQPTLQLQLPPATLTQTPLSDYIRQLSDALSARSRLPIKLGIEGDCKLPPEVQVAC